MSDRTEATSSDSKQEKSWVLSPASIVYWSRLGFAVLAAATYTVLGLGLFGAALSTLYAVVFGILFYAVSVFVVRYVLRYGETELKGPRKHVSLGMGSFIIWLIFTITILNTLLHSPPQPPP